MSRVFPASSLPLENMASWWKQSDYKSSWDPENKDKNHPWSNAGTSNYQSDNRKSSWKDWQSEDYEEELRSPQGKRKQELQLPAEFRPDSQCHDTRKFFKQVQLTNWSQKHGLLGMRLVT